MNAQEFNLQLAEVFGASREKVVSIRVTAANGQNPTVTISRFMHEKEQKDFLRLVDRTCWEHKK